MRIAYLVHTAREYEEIVEMVNQLTKQGDHVFIMINDNDLRDEIFFVYADYNRVHIAKKQEYAQSGDLSMARGMIIQMKDACELGGFDYYINLSDGMIPVKTRTEIVDFLTAHKGKDFYYTASVNEQTLRQKSERYYPFTNMLAFPTSRFVRFLSKGTAKLFDWMHIRRNLSETYRIGSPWFMLSDASAQILSENFSYVAETYKLGWYPEEMYIPMMMNRFVYINGRSDDHINQDYRAVGPEGKWRESHDADPITPEILANYPEALFAGKITADDSLSLFSDYFDIYNRDTNGETLNGKKYVDPNQLIDSIVGKKDENN